MGNPGSEEDKWLRNRKSSVCSTMIPWKGIHLNMHDKAYLYSRHTRVGRLCPHQLQSTLFLGNYSDRFQAD